jgi:oxygen-dependent protoporphyrinogen oxidase
MVPPFPALIARSQPKIRGETSQPLTAWHAHGKAPPPMPRRRVVIVGGGISGLAIARNVLDRSPAGAAPEVVVLEASRRTGGAIRTVVEGERVLDLGPSGFLNRHPSTVALADRLGLAESVIAAEERNRGRYIARGGKLHRFPDSPAALLKSDLLSMAGRARLLLEPLVPRRTGGEEESLGAFARRRLGREAAEVLVDPMITGIYAGDFDRLSLEATVPHLAAWERSGKSLLLTLLRERQASLRIPELAPRPGSRFSPKAYLGFRGGFGELSAALEASLGDRVERESPALAVRKGDSGWLVEVGGPRGRRVEADVVISAAPSTAARRYLAGLDPATDELLASIRYAPCVVVTLAYRAQDVAHPLDGFGHLVPSREGGSVLGVHWSHRIFPDRRAAPGEVLFGAILGGSRDPAAIEAEDLALETRLRAHLEPLLGISGPPTGRWIARHSPGLPQYERGHRRRLESAERSLPAGLFLGGNAFRGVGLGACTADAERIAGAVLGYLATLPVTAEAGAERTVSW